MVWATARGRSEADVFTYLWGSDAGKPRVKEGRQAWDGMGFSGGDNQSLWPCNLRETVQVIF